MLWNRYIVFVTICGVTSFSSACGQENLKVFLHPDKFYKKYLPHLKIRHIPLDTAYIKTYPNYLSVGIHLLSPALHSSISPKNSGSIGNRADARFRTNVADIIGFSANYRFVSVGFALLLKQGFNKHDGYAPSSYRTATIKYSNPVYALQFRYLKLKGFTDIHGYGAPPFAKRPDMENKEFQLEGIYNFDWKRYSYIAPLVFSQRQVKSRAGFLIKGGLYYKKFAGDSALIGVEERPYYKNFGDSRGIQTFSLKLAPGGGGNLIFYRRICLSMAVFTSFDLYFYRYMSSTNNNTHQSMVFAVDGYISLGYHSERFYGGLRYETDRRYAALRGMRMNIVNAYTGLEFGYRFNAPRIVKKVYKKTMPPGM